MTIKDVERILKEVNFNMAYCSILDRKTVRAGDGIVMFHEEGVYKVFNVERQVPYDIEEHNTEHDASKAFLKKLEESFGAWYDFSKYIQ